MKSKHEFILLYFRLRWSLTLNEDLVVLLLTGAHWLIFIVVCQPDSVS